MKLIKIVFKYIKSIFYFLFLKQRRFRKSLYSKLKIQRFIRNNSTLKNKTNRDKIYLRKCKEYYWQNLKVRLNTNWHYTFSTMNGQQHPEYIPEYLFFAYIEPTLNNQLLYKAYTDKNASHFFMDKKHLPKTFFRVTNGIYFDDDFEVQSKKDALAVLSKIKDKIVLKPAIDSGGGKNVLIKSGSEISFILQNDSKYEMESYIVQEKIMQHNTLSQFHPSSVNTLRIMTARVKDEIVVLSTFFRMGYNNSTIDNSLVGGVVCGINTEGKLRKSGMNMQFIRHEKHPDTGIAFHNIEIPGIVDAWELCQKTHKKMPHFTFISWDIAINENCQPICIEYNISNQGIFAHQLNNGPLFGKYTLYFFDLYNKMKLIQ